MRAARAGAECAPMSVSRSWISAIRCGSVACSASARRLARSASADKHPIDQTVVPARRLLRDVTDPGVARNRDGAVVGRDFALEQRSKVVLPAPLRPTRPTLWPEGIAAVAPSRIGLPSILKVRSLICSMGRGDSRSARRCHGVRASCRSARECWSSGYRPQMSGPMR